MSLTLTFFELAGLVSPALSFSPKGMRNEGLGRVTSVGRSARDSLRGSLLLLRGTVARLVAGLKRAIIFVGPISMGFINDIKVIAALY